MYCFNHGQHNFLEIVLFSIHVLPSLQMAQTPLHISAGYNMAEVVKFLLAWPGPDKIELEAKNMVRKIYEFLISHFLAL